MYKNIFEAERAITSLILKDNNCSGHFRYAYQPNTCKLDLITYNPVHKTHFLLHTITGTTQLDTLNKMYNYVFNLKKTLKSKENKISNYTINWYNNENQETFNSSFYGISLIDVIRKFYYGKSQDSINIFNNKLNPIS